MTIRREQMQAFGAVAEQALIRRIFQRLRGYHAARLVRLPYITATVGKLPDTTLEVLISDVLAWAAGYGLSGEKVLQTFAILVFVHSPGFHRHPDVEAILNERSLAPDIRIDALWNMVPEATWREIEGAYDPEMWRWRRGMEDHA